MKVLVLGAYFQDVCPSSQLREEICTQLHMWSGQEVATAVVELYINSLGLSQCREHTDLTVKMDNEALHDIFVRFVGGICDGFLIPSWGATSASTR